MLAVIITMLVIIVVASAVLVYAAFPDRGIEPARGRSLVRAVSWIAARLDDLLNRVARLIARLRAATTSKSSR